MNARTIVTTLLILVAGCQGASQPAALNDVGKYGAAPPSMVRPTLGVLPFAAADDSTHALGDVAADQVGTLVQGSGRFVVVPRARTIDAVGRDRARPGVPIGRVPGAGIDYLLVGALSNLRIVRDAPPPAPDGVVDRVKAFASKLTKDDQPLVSAECTVALQIFDPATGDVVVTTNSAFQARSPAAALGLDLLGERPSAATTQPRVGQADRVAIARLALDDAVRKSLPKIDRFLASHAADVAPPSPPAPPQRATMSPGYPMVVMPTTRAATSATKTCPTCGAENDAMAAFCKRCGAKL